MHLVHWVVSALPLVAFVVEYILPEDDHERIQLFFLGLWNKLDDVKFKNIGIEEAQCCLSIFDKIFSKKLFSLRRYVSSLCFCSIFIIVFYILTEVIRITHGQSVRWPFFGIDYNTNLFADTLFGAVAFSITRSIIVLSIQGSRYFGNSTLYFIAFSIFSAWALEAFFVLVSVPLTQDLGIFVIYMYYYFIGVITHTPVPPNWIGSLTLSDFIRFLFVQEKSAMAATATDVTRDYFTHLSLIRSYFLQAAYTSDSGVVFTMYTIWTQLCFAYLRMIFAVGFILIWSLYYLHRAITRCLQTFLEFKKGALTIMAVGASAVTSFLLNISN